MHVTAAASRNFSFLAALFTIMLCILFGANAVAIKITFAGLGVFTTAGLRFAIAAIAIYLWARSTGRSAALKKGQFRQALIFASLFAGQLSLFYLGLSKSNASRGTLIANLVPFFVLFLAHFFIRDDRITLRKFVGILMGFCGVVFVFLEKKGVSAALNAGDFIILLATFVWACNAVYVKKIIANYRPYQIVLYSMLLAVPVFFLEALLFDGILIGRVDFKILGALLYQALVTASFGFVAWNSLLQKYGAVALHSFVFIMPVAGVALGGLVLGEPITGKILLALLLIVSGILVVHLKPEKEIPVYPIRKSP